MESSGWAYGYSASDFELLCPNGERVPLTEWESCNLGVIPPSVVMTRPVITAKIQDFLMKSQQFLKTNEDSTFQLFKMAKPNEEGDLLFKDSATCLLPVGLHTLQDILGESFMQLADDVFDCTNAGILDFCNTDICADTRN
ncbi:unnamed protein product [Staurois parvus]|uniref:Transferrin-like domain-containing protein n=1 Tax=Staurois parvus TaxID=386267 RepID=A0ABN9F0N7_9NEOB|nr:unnamed protein product [Staurois parvus]